MTLSRQIAEACAAIRFEDIPAPAIKIGKACIIDCLGVTVAGAGSASAQIIEAHLDECGGRPVATVIGSGRRTSASLAAFANGYHGHVLDYDDTTGVSIGHATVAVLPALLALAERYGKSGREVLHSYLVSTEVHWALGYGLVRHGNHYAKGWHSTGTIGAIGAAAGCAHLLGLDAERTAMAIGIAASGAAGFQAQFGTHCKPFHAGRANETALRAAMLARDGFQSAPAALENKVGFLNLVADRFEPDRMAGIGRDWGIAAPTMMHGMILKAHPVLAGGLGAVEAARKLADEHGLGVEAVRSIHCRVFPQEINLVPHHRPTSAIQARFSVEYWVAATLVYGKLGLTELTDEAVRRPEIQELLPRITIGPDPTIPHDTNHIVLDVTLMDGRTLRLAQYPFKGTPEMPLSGDDLAAKVMDCADYGGLPRAQARRAMDMLLGLEELADVAPVLGCLTRPAA